MIEIGAVVVLLICILVFLKLRKKNLANIQNTNEVTKPPVQQKAETLAPQVEKPSEQKAEVIETTKPVTSSAPKVAVTPTTQVKAATVQTKKTTALEHHSSLPQDASLRRHYLTQLRTMISCNMPSPTDSALKRHHETHINAEILRCLNDKAAMENMIAHYEQYKKGSPCSCPSSKTQQASAVQPAATVEQTTVKATCSKTKACQMPEDSMLRRHYLAQLHAQVAASLAPRPTDATLRRHYDNLLENEVKKYLAC